MVHALREAHRVLKPDGLLIDLRPAAVHRRVGVTGRGEDYRLSWVMREHFDDDLAADRAVIEVVGERWFRQKARVRFPCYRLMDTFDEFKAWLTDFVERGKCSSHDWLAHVVERKLQQTPDKASIVVSAPLILRALEKSREP